MSRHTAHHPSGVRYNQGVSRDCRLRRRNAGATSCNETPRLSSLSLPPHAKLAASAAVVLALLLASSLWAAPVTAYVRGAEGKWLKTQANDEGGRITLSLKPEQIGGGETVVIVNKPVWMVLEDNEAPKLAWLRLNGVDRKAEGGDLGVLSKFPVTIALGLKDNANPLNPQGVQVSLPLEAGPAQPDVAELGPPKPNGRMSFEIPQLPPGEYAVRVSVPDLSPQANTLTVPLSFRVIGFAPSDDLQTIRIGTPGGGFTFRAKKTGELQVGDTTPAYLSTGLAGQYLYIDKIERVETLQDTAHVKTIRLHVRPGETDKQEDGAKLARLEYDLTVRDDLPCLLVTSRTINLGAKQEVYTWWGWLPGTKWADPAGEHEWSGKYQDVGKVGWVFLPQGKAETPGIGWITPQVFGESRFNTMLLYTEPTRISTETDGGVEIRFGLMPASRAEDVAATAEKIKALGLW
jgi:hypothetical protein